MTDIIQLSQNMEDMEEFIPLPPGPYIAEVREVEVRYTEKSPNGFFYMVLLVDTADYPADYDVENAPEGMKLTYARVRVPDPTNRRTVAPFKNLLKACGIAASGNAFDPGDLVGKSVQVLVSRNEYQGQLVNNVETISELPSV